MKIEGSVALVTGANRGLGRVYARELVRRGAVKVYGAARDPRAVTEPGVTPVRLDITDPELVAEAAARCADVSLLVNNAGVMQVSTFTDAPSLDAARLEMETNYFGTLRMCRAFAPASSVPTWPRWSMRPRSARNQSPSRPATPLRAARPRSSPTNGPGSSRPRCPATTN